MFIFICSYYNLTTVLYEEIEVEDNSRIVAVVKKGIDAESMKDLQQKKACFPEFGGLGKFCKSNIHVIFRAISFITAFSAIHTSSYVPSAFKLATRS